MTGTTSSWIVVPQTWGATGTSQTVTFRIPTTQAVTFRTPTGWTSNTDALTWPTAWVGTDDNYTWPSTIQGWAQVYGADTNTIAVVARLNLQRQRRGPSGLQAPAPVIRSYDRGLMFAHTDQAEMVALQLLRQMVSQADFRRYLRHGFVCTRGGTTGLTYQVDRAYPSVPIDGQRYTLPGIIVRDGSERIAALCTHMRHRMPPTDEVVAKMLMIECDEADIWKQSNVTWLSNRRVPFAIGGRESVHSTVRTAESVALVERFERALDTGLAVSA